jgi:hypothetical protein
MNELVHIVQVHPLENGWANLSEVLSKRKFDTREQAEDWVINFNYDGQDDGRWARDMIASYYGCVNDATGELV